jgi:hypothetical protein
MMQTETLIRNSEQQLTEPELQEFEKTYDIILPADYRQFILRHNGGTAAKEFYKIDDGFPGDDDGVYLAVFRSIKYGTVTVDAAIRNFKVLENLIPQHFIPVTDDIAGNPICISFNKDEFGRVYIVYLDLGGSVRFVADSFIALLNGIISEK